MMANGLTLENINGGSFNLQYSGTGLLPQTMTIAESGNGLRVQSDFSNSAVVDRTFFQTNVVNGNTLVGVLPNGTGTTAAVQAVNNQVPTNASTVGMYINGTTAYINSTVNGSGTQLPLAFLIGGNEALKVDTSKNVLVTGAGGLGYGTGSGGTVSQVTSKSTAVTLNKPTGQITMNNAALAANTAVLFQFNNASIAATDSVVVNVKSGFATNATYRCWVEEISTGGCKVILENRSGSSLSEAVVLNFTVIKGAIA